MAQAPRQAWPPQGFVALISALQPVLPLGVLYWLLKSGRPPEQSCGAGIHRVPAIALQHVTGVEQNRGRGLIDVDAVHLKSTT